MITTVIEGVCLDCANRHMKCHIDCEKYLFARAEYDRKKEFIRLSKEKDRLITGYSIESGFKRNKNNANNHPYTWRSR